MQRINQLPTARDLWRAATLIAFVSAVLGVVGMRLELTDDESRAALWSLKPSDRGRSLPAITAHQKVMLRPGPESRRIRAVTRR